MSDDDLDPALRHKVAALYGEPEAPLGDEALARVIAAAQQEAARLPHVRRRRRFVLAAGGGLAAAAAVALAFIGARRQESVPGAHVAEAACALPFGAQQPVFARADDGRQQLSLGALGELSADPSAALHVERASACELSVQLTRGVLAGDLRNLRPAVLRIRTQLGEVVVRGTRFSVAADDALEVVLLSGIVEVQSPSRPVVRLAPGNTLRKNSASATEHVSATLPEHAQKLEALLARRAPQSAPVAPSTTEATPAVPAESEPKAEPERSSAELLSAAEAERQRGQLQKARALYREAGTRRDENAEVALLRWVGLELDASEPAAAHAALEQYRRRFEHGRLEVEAAWLDVRTSSALGRPAQARAAAERLIARFPTTPQATAARQLLDSR